MVIFNQYHLTYSNKNTGDVLMEEHCTLLGLHITMVMSCFASQNVQRGVKCSVYILRQGLLSRVISKLKCLTRVA